MKEFEGKRLLVLGGGYASYHIVKIAKEEGAYVIATDYLKGGQAKDIADEAIMVSTVDMESLEKVVKEKNIDGVFCGPSEFNIVNVMTLCERTGLPFYATREQWDICSDKELFKKMCRENNVPCVPEYSVTEEFLEEDLAKIKYPVIVKPVDSSSSRGITIVYNREELIIAYKEALKFSNKEHVLVEKYISNDCAFAVRYIAYNGEIHLLLTNDRYVVDPIERKALVGYVAVYPSKLNEKYMKTIDPNVRIMFKKLGIKNGAFFMQALVDPDDGQIYFHEMGLRLSGGLTYTITESATGINDAKMMLRYALGMDFSSPDEIKKIDTGLCGKIAVSVCYPLKNGRISQIQGIDLCKNKLNVVDFVQYYFEGDEVTEQQIGTLDQHFCRIKLLLNDYFEIAYSVDFIMDSLKVIDENGNDMLFSRFETKRLRR